MGISVLIPTLNEEENLPSTIALLHESEFVSEIIVGDADSDDETVRIAKDLGCRVLENLPRSRAVQLNRCAEIATGEVLLFLHADTRVSNLALANLQSKLEQESAIVGGGFLRSFDSPSLLLKFTCWLAGWRGRWWGIFYGDQGIFIRKQAFEDLAGFDESVSLGEDLELSLRMRDHGKTAAVGPAVLSSARRFEKEGAFRRCVADWKLARQLRREFGS